MKNRKFGVEIEVTLGPDYIHDRVADAISEIGEKTVDVETAIHWSVKEDSSCGGELTTPAYRYSNANLRKVEKVLRALNVGGDRIVDRRCGLHVHVDVDDFSDEDCKSLVTIYKHAEDVLLDCLPRSRRDNQYCHRLCSNTCILDRPAWFQHFQQHFLAVNFSAYNDIMTYEVRYAAGTTNPSKVVNWVTLIVAITDIAKRIGWRHVPQMEDIDRFSDFVVSNHVGQYRDNVDRAVEWIRGRHAQMHQNLAA